MKTPLSLALCAILAACGGGSDSPEPTLLYSAEATASGSVAPGERARERWNAVLAGPSVNLGRATSGEGCLEGEWVQTGAAAAPIRLSIDSVGPPVVLSNPVQYTATITSGQTVTMPFRVCKAFSAPSGIGNVEARISMVTTGGASYALGAYSVRVRWTYTGS